MKTRFNGVLSVLATLVFGASMLVSAGGASAQLVPTAKQATPIPINHNYSPVLRTIFAPSCWWDGQINLSRIGNQMVVIGSASFGNCTWPRWMAHYLPVLTTRIEDIDNPLNHSDTAFAGGQASSAGPGLSSATSTRNVMIAHYGGRYRLVASLRPKTLLNVNDIDNFTLSVVILGGLQ